MTSHVRHDMRATSVEAHVVEGKPRRSAKRKMVLDAFANRGSMTGQECTRVLRRAALLPEGAWPVHPTICALRSAGMLAELPRRLCKVTGRSAIVYAIPSDQHPGRASARVGKPSRSVVRKMVHELRDLVRHRLHVDPEYAVSAEMKKTGRWLASVVEDEERKP